MAIVHTDPFYSHYTGQSVLAGSTLRSGRFYWCKVQLTHFGQGEDARDFFLEFSSTVLPTPSSYRMVIKSMPLQCSIYFALSGIKT